MLKLWRIVRAGMAMSSEAREEVVAVVEAFALEHPAPPRLGALGLLAGRRFARVLGSSHNQGLSHGVCRPVQADQADFLDGDLHHHQGSIGAVSKAWSVIFFAGFGIVVVGIFKFLGA